LVVGAEASEQWMQLKKFQ